MNTGRHLRAGSLALAAAAFLSACGGGGGGGAIPGTPATPLFGAGDASQLQDLVGAGPPVAVTEAEGAQRAAQDRMLSAHLWWLSTDATAERGESLRKLALGHWADAGWHGILSKGGFTLEGNRTGDDRALRVDTDHFEIGVFTTDALGGGIFASGWAARDFWSGNTPIDRLGNSGHPEGTATWRGLMIGAAKNDGRDLLQGDATVVYSFDTVLLEVFGQVLPFAYEDVPVGGLVDVNLTGIVNLDRMAPHAVPAVSFADVPVNRDGFWGEGGYDTPRFIRGAFGGSGHEVVGGSFGTPDMAGAFGATRR